MRRLVLAATALALSLGGIAVAADDPPPPVVVHYVVESGDTFTSIAAEFGVTVGSLALANPVQWARPDHVIFVGDVLHVVVEQGGGSSTSTEPSTSTSLPPSTTTTSTTSSPATSTSTSTTTSLAPTTTTTLPPPPQTGTFTDSFANLNQWQFAHWRNEIPGNGSAASTATIAAGAARIVAADQNYGDATLRSLVPYDLSAGGTVAFTASLAAGAFPLVGYPFVAFTDRPYNAPSVDMDNGHGPTPQNGVYVQFRDNCRIPWGPPQIVRYTNYAETPIETADQCLASPPAGNANRVELRYANGVLTIVIDGQTIRSAAVTVPPVGWFMLGVHNHASDKYNPGQLSVDVRYDNVTYPSTTTGRAFVVFNAYGRNAAPAVVTINGHTYPFTPHVTTSGSFAESVEIAPTDAVGTATVTGFDVVAPANVAVVRPSTGGSPPSTGTTTTTTTSVTPSSTSSQPATTSVPSTSVPPSSTPPSSSSVPPATTTSTPSTSTTLPPIAGAFSATFQTAADLDRFEFQLHTSSNGTPCEQNPNPAGGCVPLQASFPGEHNEMCGNPYTTRTILGGQTSGDDVSGLVYHCAPGGPDTGHFMTAVDTTAIATLSFSPRQTFRNVRRVCWDQNMTNLGEGKWLNVFIVPAADVAAHGGTLAYAAGTGLPFGGIPQMLPPGAVDFSWIRGSIMSDVVDGGGNYQRQFDQWMSIDPVDTNGDGRVDRLDAPTRGIATDPAPRFTTCIDDAANVLTIERPNGTTDTYPYTIPFPQGDVRVIFEDASYNPLKHGNPAGVTWHWDNITIE